MSIQATYVDAATFTAMFDADGQKDLRAQCPAGVSLRADCGADGYKYGVVTAYTAGIIISARVHFERLDE